MIGRILCMLGRHDWETTPFYRGFLLFGACRRCGYTKGGG